jgi:acetyltransferase-like isoleucine patch superfamily enzyme
MHLGKLFLFGSRAFRRLRMHLYRGLFRGHGANFWFDPAGTYSFRNITVGHDVNLGLKPIIYAEMSEVVIGNKVMFGPEVVVVGGGHNVHVVGNFMVDVKEKTGNEDLGVVIGDDVWVGARALILRGVDVGRGSIVGAGAIVTKSVPPYAVVAGSPAHVVGFRFDVEAILRHESLLYPAGDRLARADLEQFQRDRRMLPPKRLDPRDA